MEVLCSTTMDIDYVVLHMRSRCELNSLFPLFLLFFCFQELSRKVEQPPTRYYLVEYSINMKQNMFNFLVT